MLLSAFSHLNLIHLALNMYVLYSFGGAIIDRFLGPNQVRKFSDMILINNYLLLINK